MSELSTANAAEWLSRHGLPSTALQFRELGGGISNKVILAEGNGFRAVLKQSLGQLRTEQTWLSDRGRIFRESAAMRQAGGDVPRVLFEDRSTFTIGMEAAPANAEMWKTRLFRGELDPGIALAAGAALGSMIARSWNDPETEKLFGDQTVFDQLRLDPYYRSTAKSQPAAAPYIAALIQRSGARRISIVHGDYSPKNLLVGDGRVWVIDWEVVHYGDPSFDAGFLLNHLLLKSIAMPQHAAALADLSQSFLQGLSAELPNGADEVIPAAFEHLPALMLARVHGKSPAEYLDAEMCRRVSALALDFMRRQPKSIGEVFQR